MNTHAKCNLCGNEGLIYLEDKRRYKFYCPTCGQETYLKFINQGDENEQTSGKLGRRNSPVSGLGM